MSIYDAPVSYPLNNITPVQRQGVILGGCTHQLDFSLVPCEDITHDRDLRILKKNYLDKHYRKIYGVSKDFVVGGICGKRVNWKKRGNRKPIVPFDLNKETKRVRDPIYTTASDKRYKSCQIYTTASAMDFSNEVIEEVLMRLPVKLVMIFKCVSKYWNNVISDGSFRRRYVSRQQSKRTGFIWHTKFTNNFSCISSNCEKEELESFNNMNKFGSVIAASKGLLLLNHETLKSLYVYDLVSKKNVKLPRNFQVLEHDYLGFKCEEKSINHHHRICYKVVCIEKPSNIRFAKKLSNNVKVYSSDIGTWQKSTIKGRLPFYLPWGTVIAKVIGGVFHWYLSYLNHVIAYDCDDPKGRAVTIQLPLKSTYLRRWDNGHELEGTKDGSLQLININDHVVDVWILRNTTGGRSYMDEDIIDANRWNLSSRVNVQDVGLGVYSDLGRIAYIIGADTNDARIIYLRIGPEFYAYNYYQGKTVALRSSTLFDVLGNNLFVQFEWPTWPCL